MEKDGNGYREILGDEYSYLKLIAIQGSDQTIVEAARMSTQKGFLGWGDGIIRCQKCGLESGSFPDAMADSTQCPPGTHDMRKSVGDERLLAYLWHNRHTTPFEMVQIHIEVQAPIFVFREWHRHRTQSYSEMSARYEPLPDVNYVPSVERLLILPTASRQSQGLKTLMPGEAARFRDMLQEEYSRQEGIYRWALNSGVPKELARVVLPVGRYSRMQASTDLWNWLHFLQLRLDVNAQWEIRQYAVALSLIIREHLPRTYALFHDEQEAKVRA